VFVIPHHAYRAEELERPREALAAAGVEVLVASSSLGPASDMQGQRGCDPDLLYSAVDPADLDVLVFVGGTGCSEFFDDRTAHGLAQSALARGKLVAAICFAPSILANAGLLEGRRATCAPGRRAHLAAHGVELVDAPLVRDGALLTGRGPQDSEAFAQALVEALQ